MIFGAGKDGSTVAPGGHGELLTGAADAGVRTAPGVIFGRRKGAIHLTGRQGARVSESARLSAQATIRAALAKRQAA